MSNEALAKTFGRTEDVRRNYEDLKTEYLRKLKEGGKAPFRFVPETSDHGSKDELKDMLFVLIEELNLKIDNFSEEELDFLLIPHPLLGNLSLREMLYNAIYHVEHHQVQIRQNLLGIK